MEDFEFDFRLLAMGIMIFFTLILISSVLVVKNCKSDTINGVQVIQCKFGGWEDSSSDLRVSPHIQEDW